MDQALLDGMAYRLQDTDLFLKDFVKDDKDLNINKENINKFVIGSLIGIMCNQAVLLTYFLQKEGHPGLPGEVLDIGVSTVREQ
jgi:hypothetical protein